MEGEGAWGAARSGEESRGEGACGAGAEEGLEMLRGRCGCNFIFKPCNDWRRYIRPIYGDHVRSADLPILSLTRRFIFLYIRLYTKYNASMRVYTLYIRSIVLKNRCQSVISKYHECMYVHGVPSPLPPPCVRVCVSRCNLLLHDVANLAHAPTLLSPANFYCLFYCPPSSFYFSLYPLRLVFPIWISTSGRV